MLQIPGGHSCDPVVADPRPQFFFFFFNDTPPTEISPLPLPAPLPLSPFELAGDDANHAATRHTPNAECGLRNAELKCKVVRRTTPTLTFRIPHSAFKCSAPCTRSRSEEHTSELQSRLHLVCRLLLEKK